MIVKIPYSLAQIITSHAQSQTPKEVCGLLLGRNNIIQQAIPISNIAEHPTTTFYMDPNEQIKALKQIDETHLHWIGIYHSHPKSPPIISKTDIKQSTDDNLFHIIISLEQTKPKLKAWKISQTRIYPIDLVYDTQKTAHIDIDEPLSNGQKLAIILAGIISVILMLAISFTLLPPAPIITPMP